MFNFSNYYGFHHVNPYEGFDHESFPYLKLKGWGSDHEVFEKLILEKKPKLIFEVGTWLGASAIHMAKIIKENNLDCKIICIDTWLGALEMLNNFNDTETYQSLDKYYGFPSVYYQFLANVCKMNCQDIIMPFATTSVIAARFFARRNIKADLIYIDGSHDYIDVKMDLLHYAHVVSENGMIFGDDYCWEGVKQAVDEHVSDNNTRLELLDSKWIIR
jgi:predicted O-methyltransferase YrrM